VRYTEIKDLAVRPELRRRAPVEFSHSLTNVRDLSFLAAAVKNLDRFRGHNDTR
jgi:hypothetical protein